MKICFVNALFYPFKGGTENHMYELGEALVKKGVEVHVVTAHLKGTPTEETMAGIKVHRIPAKVVKIEGLYPPPLVMCQKFLQYLREIDERENFDLFHLHGRWFPDFTVVRKYCDETNKPLVLTVHNARPTGINTAYTLFGSAYEAAIGINVLKSADQLIAVSKWTRDDVLKYGIAKKKFTVIYNGINAQRFSTRHNPAVKKNLRMKHSDPLFMWVGRVIEQKGLKYLLAAMPLVLKEIPTAKLLIIGTGTELKKLKKLAAKLKIQNSIVFHGAENNRKKINGLLRGADAFVFPSIWEPFGIVIIEAMASGLPVVAASTGGIPEIIEHGKNGLLVPARNSKKLAEAMLKLASNEKLRKKIGAVGRKTAEKNFNWKKISRETIAVYRKAMRVEHKKLGLTIENLTTLQDELVKKLKSLRKKALTSYLEKLKKLQRTRKTAKWAEKVKKLFKMKFT